MRIRVSITTGASPADVWAALADIGSHAQWMRDAEEIVFVGDLRRGVGTTFDCRTRVGPFVTVDRMEVTRWDEGRAIGVDHHGIVQGSGVFEIVPQSRGTELTWTEDLVFPRRFGGIVTTWLARPVLRALWRGNLKRFVRRYL